MFGASLPNLYTVDRRQDKERRLIVVYVWDNFFASYNLVPLIELPCLTVDAAHITIRVDANNTIDDILAYLWIWTDIAGLEQVYNYLVAVDSLLSHFLVIYN